MVIKTPRTEASPSPPHAMALSPPLAMALAPSQAMALAPPPQLPLVSDRGDALVDIESSMSPDRARAAEAFEL
jgi:hypothetical protein